MWCPSAFTGINPKEKFQILILKKNLILTGLLFCIIISFHLTLAPRAASSQGIQDHPGAKSANWVHLCKI